MLQTSIKIQIRGMLSFHAGLFRPSFQLNCAISSAHQLIILFSWWDDVTLVSHLSHFLLPSVKWKLVGMWEPCSMENLQLYYDINLTPPLARFSRRMVNFRFGGSIKPISQFSNMISVWKRVKTCRRKGNWSSCMSPDGFWGVCGKWLFSGLLERASTLSSIFEL